jgi:hypothetical protein
VEQAVEESTIEELPLRDTSCCKVVVTSIVPAKDEMEAIRPQLEQDLSANPITLVPWLQGMTMRFAVLAINNQRPGEPPHVVESIKIDRENVKVILPFGHRQITSSDSIMADRVAKGWFRIRDENGRTSKLAMPAKFAEWTPKQRFQFWLSSLGKKFGIPQLKPGTVFFCFLNLVPKKSGGGYYYNWYPDFYDKETNEHINAPRTVTQMSKEEVDLIQATIDARWAEDNAQRKATAGTQAASTGTDATGQTGAAGYPDDWDIGF